MNVKVEYAAQVKRAAGVGSEEIECNSPCTVQQLVAQLADQHGDPLKNLLVDQDGNLQRSILLFIGDNQARWDDPAELNDRDTVTILSPISGG